MTALTTILLALTSWHDGLPVTLSDFHEPLPTVAAPMQEDIEGEWLMPNGNYKIKISRDGDVYRGEVVWIKPGVETKDVHNPDKSLRSRDVLGLTILDGFRYRAESGTWTGGTIYGIHKGKTLKASLRLEGKQSLKAKMSIGLMSRTATLTRAQ
jgi:uncharacterized protein (DUF2147 family)